MGWARWLEGADQKRIVQQTRLFKDEPNEALVSTVFLGLDHDFYGAGPPLLFETMVFGGLMNDYQHRCTTYEQAQAMHIATVEEVIKLGGTGGNVSKLKR
jgi:hypothetical protein